MKGTGFVAEIENSMIIIKEIVRGEQKKARVIKGLITDEVKARFPE